MIVNTTIKTNTKAKRSTYPKLYMTPIRQKTFLMSLFENNRMNNDLSQSTEYTSANFLTFDGKIILKLKNVG